MIQPLFNQILVKPHAEERTLISEKQTLNEWGTVLAVGEDCKKIKVGDVIAFTIWGLNATEYKGERVYLVQENPDFLLFKDDGVVEEK